MREKAHGGWLLAVALLGGCATDSPSPDRPPVPRAWEQSVSAEAARWPTRQWYHGFSSDELDRLIRAAETNNTDIAVAQARILQADAHARAAGAAILPQINAGMDATYYRGRSNGQSAHEIDTATLLSASYEVDFWGRNRAAVHSAQAAARASRADWATVALTAQTGVANTYFEVLSLRERIAIAHSNLEAARNILQVIETRYQAGAATPVELAEQRAAVANAQIAIPDLEKRTFEAQGALALLVGHEPERFTIGEARLDALLEPEVTPGLPSELLARRPDVIAAESNLLAAHADLAAARAAYFPTLNLTAFGGLQNPAVQAAVITLDGAGSTLTLGASLAQRIFDGGQRRAQRDEADAKEQEWLAAYRGSVLAALLDVENALAAIRTLEVQRQAQTDSLAQSERAFEGAQLRFREGAGDYLAVLESQRALYAAQEQWSQYRLARLQARVALCKALGGGWEEETR